LTGRGNFNQGQENNALVNFIRSGTREVSKLPLTPGRIIKMKGTILLLIFMLLMAQVDANRIIIDKGKQNIGYAKWTIKQFRVMTPYNETKWSIVYITNKTIQKPGDLRIIIKDINAWGYGYPDKTLIIIDPDYKSSIFLLFHECGHAYGFGHTSDGSIMDTNGGDAKYRQYQVDLIRRNLWIKSKQASGKREAY